MTLKDLSVSNIERVRRDLWSWSQMDKPLLAPATFVSALQDLVDEGVMARTQMWDQKRTKPELGVFVYDTKQEDPR